MKRLHILVTTGIFTSCIAGLGGAAPLNYQRTLTVDTGDFAGCGFLRGGGVASVNSSSGSIPAHLNTLRVAASRDGPTHTLMEEPSSTRLTASSNVVEVLSFVGIEIGTGTLAPIAGGAASTTVLTRNVLPVRGLLKVCLLTTACTTFLPLVLTQTTANGGTIGAGIGGVITAGGEGVRISLEGAPWTIKTATVHGDITTTSGNQTVVTVVHKGFAHDPSSGTNSTAQLSGVVQLVSPAQMTTNLSFGTSSGKVPLSLILQIQFIPEPHLLLLLGMGVTGLAMIGRNRLRR